MSILFLSGDIFLSKACTIAHGCNCQGRMGAGIAIEFKRRWPKMFKEYRCRCHAGLLVPGGYYLCKESAPWILNLATQDALQGARIEFAEQCLLDLSRYYREEGITSLAMPRIAAGLGGLPWQDVKTLMCKILGPLPIPVFVYEGFQPGTKANETIPSSE